MANSNIGPSAPAATRCLGNAPHLDETLVVAGDPPAVVHHQYAVGGCVERGREQRVGLAEVILGLDPAADVVHGGDHALHARVIEQVGQRQRHRYGACRHRGGSRRRSPPVAPSPPPERPSTSASSADSMARRSRPSARWDTGRPSTHSWSTPNTRVIAADDDRTLPSGVQQHRHRCGVLEDDAEAVHVVARDLPPAALGEVAQDQRPRGRPAVLPPSRPGSIHRSRGPATREAYPLPWTARCRGTVRRSPGRRDV